MICVGRVDLRCDIRRGEGESKIDGQWETRQPGFGMILRAGCWAVFFLSQRGTILQALCSPELYTTTDRLTDEDNRCSPL
jgi:hypothetical protein